MINKLFVMFCVIAASSSSRADVIYSNTFDDVDSLSDFVIYGYDYTEYSVPSLHDVSIDFGQLRIETTSIRPNGSGTNPVLLGRASLALRTTDVFQQEYRNILSNNPGVISWTISLA